MDAKKPGSLIQRFLHIRHRHTDDPSPTRPDAQRLDKAPPDSSTASQADSSHAQTWSDIGAQPVPTGGGSEPMQLPDSRAEVGGPPVYADPDMVTPRAAEKMRPLFRRAR